MGTCVGKQSSKANIYKSEKDQRKRPSLQSSPENQPEEIKLNEVDVEKEEMKKQQQIKKELSLKLQPILLDFMEKMLKESELEGRVIKNPFQPIEANNFDDLQSHIPTINSILNEGIERMTLNFPHSESIRYSKIIESNPSEQSRLAIDIEDSYLYKETKYQNNKLSRILSEININVTLFQSKYQHYFFYIKNIKLNELNELNELKVDVMEINKVDQDEQHSQQSQQSQQSYQIETLEDYGIGTFQEYIDYRFKNAKVIEKEEFYFILKKILQPLMVLYKMKIVHGNLNPKNICLKERGIFVFSNFKRARLVQNDLIDEYELQNTYEFTAPELKRHQVNKPEQSNQISFNEAFMSDIYSIGSFLKKIYKRNVELDSQNAKFILNVAEKSEILSLLDDFTQKNPLLRLNSQVLSNLEKQFNKISNDFELKYINEFRNEVRVRHMNQFEDIGSKIGIMLLFPNDFMNNQFQEDLQKLKQDIKHAKDEDQIRYLFLESQSQFKGEVYEINQTNKKYIELAQVYENKHKNSKNKLAQIILLIAHLRYLNHLIKISEFNEASSHIDQAKSIANSIYGPSHFINCEIYFNISQFYNCQCKFDQHQEYLKKGIEILQQKDSNPELIAMCEQRKSQLLISENKLDEARKCMLKSLKIRQNLFGLYSYQSASCYGSLGLLYMKQEFYEDSKTAFEQSSKIFLKIFNDEKNEHALEDLGNIALCQKNMGQYQDSLKNFEKVEKIYRELEGDEGEHVIICQFNQGSVYLHMGELDKAFMMYQGQLRYQLSTKGEIHENTAKAYINMSIVSQKQGNSEESLGYLLKGAKIFKEIHGENSEQVIDVQERIIKRCLGMKDYDKALEYYSLNINISKSMYGETDKRTESLQKNYQKLKETAENYKKSQEKQKNINKD